MQFKLVALAALGAFFTSAIAAPNPEAAAAPIAAADAVPDALAEPVLEKRKCKSVDCFAVEGVSQGQYCGYCAPFYLYGDDVVSSHVYELNPDGGCCDYGTRKSCKDETKWQCPV